MRLFSKIFFMCLFFVSTSMSLAYAGVLGEVNDINVDSDTPSRYVLIHSEVPFLVPIEGEDNDGLVTLSWAAVTGALRYEYRICQDGVCGNWIDSYDTSVALNLSNGDYTFEVRACNADGCGTSASSQPLVVTGVVNQPSSSDWYQVGGLVADQTDGYIDALSSDTAVGALEGSGGVSGGAASYNIPIVVAPGRKGMQPNVSLSYSSRSGNGIAGMGWSLSAGSSIERCGMTVAQDGRSLGVTYHASTDKLCLDGQRLMVTSGTYGASGAVYRTELDTFARVTQMGGGINDSTTWFKVEHKGGRVSYYGESTDSRHSLSGRTEVSRWAVKRVTDRSNNNMIYTYVDQGYGEHVLTEIAYTGKDSAKGDRYIRFAYESRVKPQQGYEFGLLWKRSKRLLNIKTYYQTTQIREYNLSYLESIFSGKELLSSIQECALDGVAPVCLPETQFEWSQPSNTFARQKSNLTPDLPLDNSVNSPVPLRFSDFNGDGKLDINTGYSIFMGFDLTQHYEVSGVKDAFNFRLRRINDLYAIKENNFFDFNMDGRADVYGAYPDANGIQTVNFGLWDDVSNDYQLTGRIPLDATCVNVGDYYEVDSSAGSAWWVFDNGQGWDKGDCGVDHADMNGDGLMDLIVYERPVEGEATTVTIHLRCYGSPCSQDFYRTSFELKQQVGDIQHYRAIDINGDGRLDLVSNDSSAGSIKNVTAKPRLNVLINQWDGTHFNFVSKRYDFSEFTIWNNNSAFFWNDFNGDGLVDLMQSDVNESFWLIINNGNGFNSPVNTGLNGGRQFEEVPGVEGYQGNSSSRYSLIYDYNQDGLADIVIPESLPHRDYHYPCGGETVDSPTCEELVREHGNPPHILHRWQDVYRWTVYQTRVKTDGSITFDKIDPLQTNIIGTLAATQVQDVNSDGVDDIVTRYGYDGPIVGMSFEDMPISNHFNKGVYFYHNTAESPPDLLQGIKTGLDNRYQFTYKTLFQMALEGNYQVTKRGDEYPYFNFTSTAIFASNMERSNGIGGVNKVNYRYENAQYHAQGRGFQGFSRVIVDDLSDSDINKRIRSVTDFHQKFPLAGKVESSRTCLIADNDFDCSNTPLSHTQITNYQVQNTANSQVKWVYPTQTIKETFDLTNRALRLSHSTTTVGTQVGTDIDLYGNILQSVTESDNGFDTVRVTQTQNVTVDDALAGG